MKTSGLAFFVLLAVFLSQPLTAAEFELVSATGVREPSGLQAGQELSENTRLVLDSWGRVLIRETTKCGLTHVVAGVGEYVLKLSDNCSAAEDPMQVAGRVQMGEVFAARIKETGSGQADALVQALAGEPCTFLPRFSEEGTARGRCPPGFALRGLRCSGAYCDNKDALCCPYLEGAPDDSAKATSARWISEEFPNAISSKKFLNGLDCRGPYCDDLLPQPFKSSRLVNDGACDWTAWTSDQPGAWLDCGRGQFAAGIRCREQFCGDVGLYCCQARVE